MKVNKGKRDIRTGEKKKKRNLEQNVKDVETYVTVNNDVDHGLKVMKRKKVKVSAGRKKNKDINVVATQRPEDDEVDLEEQSVVHEVQAIKGEKEKVTTTSRKRKNKDRNLVGRQRREDVEVDLEKENDGVMEHCDAKQEEVKDSKEHKDSNTGAFIKPCMSKDAKKKRRKEVPKSPEKREQDHQEEIHIISSGDDDGSNGMKKWIMEYHQSRPGLEVLQHQIDDFVTDYEEKLEEEKKAKEALAAEGGWTVVVQRKGRKKTTDSESGIAVGSVAQAAVEDKLAKKKNKGVGLDFYRFQKREAQRNELMLLQSKFEEDKKRLQQLRAARKFRPY
ncbi:uncharacterized protein LOC127106736 isoform X1 [Lathyrus oleraceus]|uniref:Ribosomal RNA-processing protein 7 C-terminal domain-containing protein n=1 Tax=Pisum sativum TaxID=3888 RepID=A0A9D5A0E5_PEA|nr:uncharacterized protein LOC127106736 isoform X1 [Pisum sativum]KAI5388655.1 hypothetical protein KIW84_074357 [Pisum sativum]